MPSFVPGNRASTASAITWAVEWRIASSSSWAPASSSSSTEPRSGASRTSGSSGVAGAGRRLAARLVRLVRHAETSRESKRPLVHRQDERSITRRPAVPPAFPTVAAGRRRSSALAALTGGPGPVHRPLTGGAVRGSICRLPPARLAARPTLDRVSRSMRWPDYSARPRRPLARDASGAARALPEGHPQGSRRIHTCTSRDRPAHTWGVRVRRRCS